MREYINCTYSSRLPDKFRNEVLYNILNKFWISMKLVRLIKICLNKTCIGKYFSDIFPVKNGLKQGDVLELLSFNFVLEGRFMKTRWDRN
jgi:hypothetical protein